MHSVSKVALSFSFTPTILLSNVGNNKLGYSESISETAYECGVNLGVKDLNCGCRGYFVEGENGNKGINKEWLTEQNCNIFPIIRTHQDSL